MWASESKTGGSLSPYVCALVSVADPGGGGVTGGLS